MAKKKATPIDWESTLELWCEQKTANPELTMAQFCKQIKRSYNTIRVRCTPALLESYKAQKSALENGSLSKSSAKSAFELWKRTIDQGEVIPATKEGHGLNAFKHGVYSEFLHIGDLSAALQSMDANLDFEDEVMIRAKMHGVLRAGKDIDSFEDKVKARIEEQDGELTDLDHDDMASIRKARQANLNDFNLIVGRLDNTRLNRLRERHLEVDIRLKRLAGDKIALDSGNSTGYDVDDILSRQGDEE